MDIDQKALAEMETFPATLPTLVAELQNEGPDPLAPRGWEPMTAVEYTAWAGEDDRLTVACLTPHGIQWKGGEASRPWIACIWPRYKDGTRHTCSGWCDLRYRTADEAARSLEREFLRRYRPDSD